MAAVGSVAGLGFLDEFLQTRLGASGLVRMDDVTRAGAVQLSRRVAILFLSLFNIARRYGVADSS